MRLSLNALPAFRAVAELQNLRAAAERLHLTHSAVSQQIRGLEEQLGFDLFERSGRGIVLNPAGAALLCSVQEALALLDDGMRTAAAAAAGSSCNCGFRCCPRSRSAGCCRAWRAGAPVIRS